MNAELEPPEPFSCPSADRLIIREGGGCLSIFGLPFFAAGVFTTLIGLQIVPVVNRDEVPPWAWPLIALMGLAFVAVGGALVFGRRWITLDRSEAKAVKQAGLILPMRREEFPLGAYDQVRVRFQAGDSDSADRYPVALRSRSGGTDLGLTAPVDYALARRQAGFLADFLRLPLADATTDHETVTGAPSTVTGRGPEVVPGEHAARPPFMRSTVETARGRVRVVVPGPGFRWAALLGFALPVFFVCFLLPDLLEFFDRTHTPPGVQAMFAGFILLFFGALPALGTVNGIIRSIRGSTTVDASGEGIRIERRGAWRRRSVTITAAEIYGLDYSSAERSLGSGVREARERYRRSRPGTVLPPGSGPPAWLRRLYKSKGVQVKCRQGIVAFGEGLPDEEVRYLYQVVKRAIAGKG